MEFEDEKYCIICVRENAQNYTKINRNSRYYKLLMEFHFKLIFFKQK